jgi:hypothetical protein
MLSSFTLRITSGAKGIESHTEYISTLSEVDNPNFPFLGYKLYVKKELLAGEGRPVSILVVANVSLFAITNIPVYAT